MSNDQTPGRVLGIGGIFFKSSDHKALRSWYSQTLGITDTGEGAMFKSRRHDQPETEQLTVWSIFPGSSAYFEPSKSEFMINYIVDDLDALLEKLKAADVNIDPKREDVDYGRFAWIFDPDGNKIELWQPLTT